MILLLLFIKGRISVKIDVNFCIFLRCCCRCWSLYYYLSVCEHKVQIALNKLKTAQYSNRIFYGILQKQQKQQKHNQQLPIARVVCMDWLKIDLTKRQMSKGRRMKKKRHRKSQCKINYQLCQPWWMKKIAADLISSFFSSSFFMAKCAHKCAEYKLYSECSRP